MRDSKNWNQEQLAERVGMNQNAVSRLENPFYGKATLTTLKRLAEAFDVALIVRFAPFGELIDWVSGAPRINTGLSHEALNVSSFEPETELFDRTGEISQRETENYPDKAPRVATQFVLGWNVLSMDDSILKFGDRTPSITQLNTSELATNSGEVKSQNALGGPR